MSKTLKLIFSKKMLLMLLLGFSSGVPFLIIKDVLKAWMTDSGIDIKTIGLFSAVSLPYTYKFLWSPFIDRYEIPWLGRRRGWMIIIQILLLCSIGLLGQFNPQTSVLAIAAMATTIAFFSASQDIVLDAYRREFLEDNELAFATSLWSNAYRLANLASVGIAFSLASKISYQNVFWVLAALMSIGILATLFAPEPNDIQTAKPRSLREAVVEPFREFFSRKEAWLILAFLLLYKIGDNMAAAMNIPFIIGATDKGGLGVAKEEYFIIVKGIGMIALFGGMLLGGTIMTKIKLRTALLVFGLLQMVSTFGFAMLTSFPENKIALTSVIVFELLTTGLGGVAYATFIGLQTNRKFTATQFALLTSLMAIPSTVAASFTGYLQAWVGWNGFYIVCGIAALPGLLLVRRVSKSLEQTN